LQVESNDIIRIQIIVKMMKTYSKKGVAQPLYRYSANIVIGQYPPESGLLDASNINKKTRYPQRPDPFFSQSSYLFYLIFFWLSSGFPTLCSILLRILLSVLCSICWNSACTAISVESFDSMEDPSACLFRVFC